MIFQVSLSAVSRHISFSIFLLLLFIAKAQSQLPDAISIWPEAASGFEEITLTFDVEKACIPDGWGGLSGLDSIFMESSAVMLYEEEGWWNYNVHGLEGIGKDGTLPILYPDDDSLFSITFTPSAFYGTGTELIKGITAHFKDWGKYGMDYGEEGCKDFYIPFKLDTVELSLSVDMSHQIFLGNFDPFFDNIDVIGNFNDWGNPLGTDLEDPDGDSIYSVIIPDMFVGQTIKYLFRRNRNDATRECIDSSCYRTYLIQEGENNLSHWYDDMEPSLTSLTLNVNMKYAEELEDFNPETDTVEIRMRFEHWDSDSMATFLLSDPDSNGIYSTVLDSMYNGSTFNYIVNINGGNSWNLSWRWYIVKSDVNILDIWWNWYNPEFQQDLFFTGYLDGQGNNNAIEIRNPREYWEDLSKYGIMYTQDGSAWMGPLKMAGALESKGTWLIVHPGFDFSAIDSALVVDTVWSEPTTFNGNDALALVKLYDGDNKWRILDQIGVPGEDPGIGWEVAGIPGATSMHRLERKPAIEYGKLDWNFSAGNSAYNSEWMVSAPEIPDNLGKTVGIINYDNLWTTVASGVTHNLYGFASTDNGWEFAVGEAGTAIYKETGSTQWKSLNLDIPENYALFSVFFTDSLNGWMCGNQGIILHTTNGLDWSSQQSNTTATLKNIFFTDSENGWAVGAWNILHTSDGGQTWEYQNGNPDASSNKVHFTDTEHGWIACENSFIRYTTDGGDTWMQLTGIPEGAYRDLYFYNSRYGWIVGDRGIYSTRDGGNTWTKQVAPDWFYYGVHFTTPMNGVVIGDNRIFSTDDGGITWKPQSASNGNTLLHNVFFSSSNNGWIVGNDGLMLQTEDGWISQPSPVNKHLRAIAFTDDSTGWIVGDYCTVLKTSDAGRTWNTNDLILPDDETEAYYDVFFIDPMTGWFGGALGILFHTKDGGLSWDQQYAINGWLYAVYFIDRSRGWAVGNGGHISRTTDGGETWIDTLIGTENFYDVYFVDSLHGWVVGEYGRILFSDDGGLSWISQSGYTNTRLVSIYFKDTLNGIAFSDQDFLRTKNGGASWEVDNIDLYQGRPGLHFIDTIRGWISGSGGNVWHTMDGGISWVPLSISKNIEMNDLHFLNERIGWAVGDNGTILRTSSGGCKDPFVNLPGIARVCEGDEIILSGGENYTYSWSTGSVDPSITVSTAGWYSVDVGNRCGRFASDSVYLDVIPLPDFQIVADGETAFCRGNQVDLISIPRNPGRDNEYSYQWENDTAYSSSNYPADTSGYFSVRATDQYGCTKTDSIWVFEQNPFNEEELCLVTIDLLTGNNMIIWNKTPDIGTVFYNVYRESGTIGQYDLIGKVPYNDLSIFKDTTSLPETRQYLYKIALVDSCGNESDFSQYHNPLFLQYVGSIGGVNLQWTDYVVEGSPFDFVTYEIYRGSDSTALEKIAEVSASNNRYIDTYGDAINNKYYYRVAGVKATPCYPSGTKKAEGEFMRSMSNMKDNGILTGRNDLRDPKSNALLIYPNPFTDRTLIKFPNPDHKRYQLYITDLNGKVVKTIDNITEDNFELNSSGLKKGLFFIELRGAEIHRAKIIIH